MSSKEELNAKLSNLERVFKAPPLTPELIQAIRLISPQFDLSLDEESRAFWEADQNGACWGEFEALKPLFAKMQKPKRILEIGPGLGRSIVFFSKKLGWETSKIDVYEGEGEETKYTILGPRFEDSFCGNFAMLRKLLHYNDIPNVHIIDADQTLLKDLQGPYDFIFSFYAVGFHWSLEHFFSDIVKLMNETSYAVFTVPKNFTPFQQLKDINYKIVEWKTVWPKEGTLKILILSKNSLLMF